MQFFFHIGPHKTGTTALQNYFLDRYGSHAPTAVWYPAPQRLGPGHADIAERLLPQHKRGANPLTDIVETASAAGTSSLIISSENFSAFPQCLDDYKAALDGHPVTLVSTQNSLIHRAASRWQEWVKGGTHKAFEKSLDRILASPGFQVDLIERYASHLGAKDRDNLHIS
ncbi:MAG: hypothetical protein AcusKO_33860 [Acuticoccus sp.]